MKKFFSLVLALVMALSLTTVAWGYTGTGTADDPYVVADQADAQAALDAATPGTTIQLTAGVNYGTLYIRPVDGQANTTTGSDYNIYRNEFLRKVENLTIVGADGATVDAIVVVSGYIDPANNSNVSNSTCYFVDIKNLVVDSVEFTDVHTNAHHSYAAPLFFNLSYINVDGLTVNNCKLIGNNDKMNFVYFYSKQAANSTFVTAAKNITITDNTVDGIARLCELREAENVTITGNTVNNTDQHAVLLASNSGKTYSGDVTITDNTADGIGERFVRMSGAGAATVSVTDNTVTNYNGSDSDVMKLTDSTGAVTVMSNTLPAGATVTVNSVEDAIEITTDANGNLTGGTFTTAPTVPTDYEAVQLTNGTYVVVPTTALGEKFDLYLANSQLSANLKIGAASVTDVILTEVPAKTFTNGSGVVSYLKGNNGEYYVKTTTPYTTSYAVTDANKTAVLYYVNAAGNDAGAFTYTAKATEFKNFSLNVDKCGYVKVSQMPAATDVYFQLADGSVYKAAAASATEANNYLVGDTVYSKGTKMTVVDHTFTVSNAKYDTVTGASIPTQATCSTCFMPTTAIYANNKIPAGKSAYPIAGTNYSVVLNATPIVGGAVSTDKVVQSAATFDAGIAMYVGMSVMAAAGSAVVIGKKKD